jgi:hypothetical protein
MSNKQNKKVNKKQIIFVLLITFIISIVIIFATMLGVFSTNNESISNDEANLIKNENAINNNENINNETQNEITIMDITNNINFEIVNTNFVDNFTFFTNTNKENTNGGNFKVITTYDDYIDFMSANNYDISKELFTDINEKYFEKNVIICVIDTFEENYQNRVFFNFCIENATTYINFLKKESDTEIETSGYWTYMIGVSYETLGETDIELLPISVQVMD